MRRPEGLATDGLFGQYWGHRWFLRRPKEKGRVKMSEADLVRDLPNRYVHTERLGLVRVAYLLDVAIKEGTEKDRTMLLCREDLTIRELLDCLGED